MMAEKTSPWANSTSHAHTPKKPTPEELSSSATIKILDTIKETLVDFTPDMRDAGITTPEFIISMASSVLVNAINSIVPNGPEYDAQVRLVFSMIISASAQGLIGAGASRGNMEMCAMRQMEVDLRDVIKLDPEGLAVSMKNIHR